MLRYNFPEWEDITLKEWDVEYGPGQIGVGQGGGEEWMGYKVWWTGQGGSR